MVHNKVLFICLSAPKMVLLSLELYKMASKYGSTSNISETDGKYRGHFLPLRRWLKDISLHGIYGGVVAKQSSHRGSPDLSQLSLSEAACFISVAVEVAVAYASAQELALCRAMKRGC